MEEIPFHLDDIITQYEKRINECTNLIDKLKKIWKRLTDTNQELRIFKDDDGMDRLNELQIKYAREFIEESKKKIGNVIESAEQEIKDKERVVNIIKQELNKRYGKLNL